MKIVLASGHFDPLHVEHVNYLLAAKQWGDRLVVAVDSDEAVEKKYPFAMCGEDRAELVRQLDFVDEVRLSKELDVSRIIEEVSPHYYAVGAEYEGKVTSISEYPACLATGTKICPMVSLKKPHPVVQKFKFACRNVPTVVNALISENGSAMVATRAQEDGKGKSELIGGFVEPGETLGKALEREVREETGAKLVHKRYFGSYVGHYSDGRMLLSVVFTGMLDRPPVPTAECSSFQLVRHVPDDMFADCDREALRDFLHFGG